MADRYLFKPVGYSQDCYQLIDTRAGKKKGGTDDGDVIGQVLGTVNATEAVIARLDILLNAPSRAGQSRSEAKRATAASNGLKGGRPRISVMGTMPPCSHAEAYVVAGECLRCGRRV